jgi:hypothetical protein
MTATRRRKDAMPQNDLPNLEFAQLLSAKEIAGQFGVDEDTVLRWWHQGLPTGKTIPRRFMRPRGFAGYLFDPAVLDFIRAEQAKKFS